MRFRDWLPSDPMTLADIPPGMLVRISKMDKLSVEKRDHLLAFGLASGRWVEIKQHRPAVVVQVDYTELALEPEVARKIVVETPVPLRKMRHVRRGAASGKRHGRRRFFTRGRRRSHRARFFRRFWRGEDQTTEKDK
jgi:Fe2+ transport system protein FeoA